MNKYLSWAFLLVLLVLAAVVSSDCALSKGEAEDSLRSFDSSVRKATDRLSVLAVQNNGRIKPLESFARERLLDIFGERTFAGLSPTLVILSWALCPDEWSEKPIIKLEPEAVNQALAAEFSDSSLPLGMKHISPKLLRETLRTRAASEMDAAANQKKSRAWRRLQKRLRLFDSLAADLRLFPQSGSQGWAPLGDFSSASEPSGEACRELAGSLETLDASQYDGAASRLAAALSSAGDRLYVPGWRLVLEVYDNRISPFRLLAIVYLAIAVISLLGYLTNRAKLVSAASVALYLVAALHVLAVVVRGIVAGKVMASNTYEYLLAMTAVTAIGALVLKVRFKEPAFVLTGAALCGIGLAWTVLSPLSETITQLPPVLRSDWMTYHVGAAVLSYGVLYLAFGSAVAFLLCVGDRQSDLRSKLFEVNIKLVRLGFFLLAVGIITGATWADEAWGRYWGWDPKESWSLVAWCIYGLCLHLRLCLPAKKHRTILVLVSLVGFTAVLFTFIGVNYILSGLHSYG
ncbi:MAG: cytochrome c biogenesis protein CcsA [Candidatus Coatesbacteria bacterium]|nr:cytochrome c biogenesis protein CcsA [Candidatus Coatesbacteria bacterium]